MPRGWLALCRLPGLTGDLAGDVEALAALRPALVVSLTEADEHAALGAAALQEHLARAGLGWTRFPIADFSTPPPGADWPALSRRLHRRLNRAEGVVLHCRGGLGRSGMIALRLMIEAGEDPRAALARLRAARPGAVETEAQLAWALGGRPTAPA